MPKIKISQAAKEFNVSIPTVVEHLQKKGIPIDSNPNTRIDEAAYAILVDAFGLYRKERQHVDKIVNEKKETSEAPKEEASKPAPKPAETISIPVPQTQKPKVVGHINLDSKGQPVAAKPAPAPEAKPAPAAAKAPETPKAEAPKPAPAKAAKAAKPAKPAEAPASKPAEAPKAEAEPKAETAQAAPADTGEAEVFRYSAEPQVTGPKVIGHIDLTSLNQSTRPKKKGKDDRRGAARPEGSDSNGRKKRQRIGKEKVDIEKAGQAAANSSHHSGGGNGRGDNGRNESGKGGRGRGGREKRPIHTEVNE